MTIYDISKIETAKQRKLRVNKNLEEFEFPSAEAKRYVRKDRWPSENDKTHRYAQVLLQICVLFTDQRTIDLRSICDQFESKSLIVSM